MTPAEIDALIAWLRDEKRYSGRLCKEQAADALATLAHENAELTDALGGIDPPPDWRKVIDLERARAERAEAECAALWQCVYIADAMARYFKPPRSPELLLLTNRYDTARAAIAALAAKVKG